MFRTVPESVPTLGPPGTFSDTSTEMGGSLSACNDCDQGGEDALLHIEPKVHHVSVLYLVGLAFYAKLAGGAEVGFAAVL